MHKSPEDALHISRIIHSETHDGGRMKRYHDRSRMLRIAGEVGFKIGNPETLTWREIIEFVAHKERARYASILGLDEASPWIRIHDKSKRIVR